MRFEVIFLTAVLGVAVIHLLFRLVNYLAGTKRTSIPQQNKEQKGDDWYVFFDKSALYGDMENPAVETEVVNEDSVQLATSDEGHSLSHEVHA